MPFLEVEDLVVHYGRINALKGISLKLKQGQIVALIGANGAGKTTLLNTITGLVGATSGRILFKGRDILARRVDEVVRLGISQIPEGRKIFTELTVEENLLAGAYIITDRGRVAELLERSYSLFPRLAERRRQEGDTLSGGEQQMLALARGLMSDPDLLLLDEPSLGLAPILVDRIFDFILAINKLGKSILLVEQNANIALQTAGYGYVLETGRIVMDDETANLLRSESIKKAYLGIA